MKVEGNYDEEVSVKGVEKHFKEIEKIFYLILEWKWGRKNRIKSEKK